MKTIRTRTGNSSESAVGESVEGDCAKEQPWEPQREGGKSHNVPAIQLLVSVRDLSEARVAISAGVDIVDLKEPHEGPLAPVESAIWRDVADFSDSVENGVVLSAALGEAEQARAIVDQIPEPFSFAKAGPSQCRNGQQLQQLWADVRSELEATELVAVAYADSSPADCMPVEDIIVEAEKAGLKRCLIDTFTKDGRSTLDHFDLERLSKIGGLCSELGLWWALAGSIRLDQLDVIARLRFPPSCIGVRGDVCTHDRTSTLCEDRILQWQASLSQLNAARL